jgi:hypothetical protein
MALMIPADVDQFKTPSEKQFYHFLQALEKPATYRVNFSNINVCLIFIDPLRKPRIAIWICRDSFFEPFSQS